MPVINTSVIRWLIAFVVAVVLHASLIVWVTTVPKPSTLHAKKQGRGGIEVGIAQLLPAPKIPQPKITPPSKPVAKPVKKPIKKIQTKPKAIVSKTVDKQALTVPKEAPSLKPIEPVVEPALEKTSDQAQTNGGAALQVQRVSFHSRVMAHLQTFKYYPSRAKRRRMEGVVELEISIGRNGQLLNYTIVKSSQHTVLDQAAIDMLKRAQPLPIVPAEMTAEVYQDVFKIGYRVR